MYEDQPAADQPQEGALLAAIDIGSNSFHMVIARLLNGELRTVDVMSEKVQLAAGLDANSLLCEDAFQRGLACLSRFAQRLSALPRQAIRAVATNALREASNGSDFAAQAQQLLGIPLQIISGHEEARLIYLGVSHTLADVAGKRLVIDIGGGSTEFIIGERFQPNLLESLQLGCVSYSKRFFSDGRISTGAYNAARTAALQELLSIRRNYRRTGWQSCTGSSGTTKAIRQLCLELGLTDGDITPAALQQLSVQLLKFDHVDELSFSSLKPERRSVIPAGLAILSAIFESLGIEQMAFSEGALREGVLYDMAGRLRHEDVRERTITALMRRYHVDQRHALQVESTALLLLTQARDAWQLQGDDYHDLLSWAARTHEIGLALSHNRFHRHSAYLLQHSDLAGFSTPEQLALAFLTRAQRRKLPREELALLPHERQLPLLHLCLILRLATLLHRSRSKARLPAIQFRVEGQKLCLQFPAGWLDHHPLTKADLEAEIDYLKAMDYKLKIA